MRLSFNPEFIIENETLTGFNFKNGACAEHEYGIPGIESVFLNEKLIGIERRQLVEFDPDQWKYFKNDKHDRAILFFDSCDFRTISESTYAQLTRRVSHFGVKLLSRQLSKSNDISTAWNKDRFVIYVKTKENVRYLRLLWQAIQNKDIACWAGQDLVNPY